MFYDAKKSKMTEKYTTWLYELTTKVHWNMLYAHALLVCSCLRLRSFIFKGENLNITQNNYHTV